MFQKINNLISSWQFRNPWTNVYGLARSIIALSSMLTLLFNKAEIIFKPTAGATDFPTCTVGYSLFCLAQNDYFYLNLIRWAFILLLFLVVIGWKPRFTGVIHWYISYSMQNALIVSDGGEQAAAVITFLLIPITLTDPRNWHWGTVPTEYLNQKLNSKIIVFISYFFIRLQVAILYFHSTVAKLGTKEWINGTSVYYFTQDKLVGFNDFFKGITDAIVSSPFIVVPTWGTLIVQMVIFCSLFAPKKYWKYIFIFAITMHEVFALMLGLISFSIIMTGVLILFLIPIDKQLKLYYPVIGKVTKNKKREKIA
ncbi:sporulation-delaying protein SdpB family protein [Bacillus thuringiensis]|uniref:sporulation-delaying protein SdpB family protein n=1 Tax=Bacillus thuringiensis TaxID=1428 RepID=UPI000BEDC12D|nr:sporulation-delaying protein SdpB family protein [Bacillus thuringiensis]PDY26977.1 hypothetical protein COM84_25030 [Bacillus thuringiensis]PGH92603.1 hypothetical protein CN898_26480 [Bacillus thuringiensis]